MNILNGNLTKAGGVLRKERKDHNETQSKIAEIIGYVPENRANVSRAENGKMFLAPDQYDILATHWNVRKNYLLGIDDFRTEEEVEQAHIDDSIAQFKGLIQYLNSIGLSIVPKAFFITSVNELIKIEGNKEKYERLRKLYSDRGLKYVNDRINAEYRFAEYKEDLNEYIELKSIPSNYMKKYQTRKISIKEFIEEDYYGDYQTYVDDVFPDLNDIVGFFESMYEISYHGKLYARKKAYYVQSFFSHIDRLCSLCIEDMLIGPDYLYGFRSENDNG